MKIGTRFYRLDRKPLPKRLDQLLFEFGGLFSRFLLPHQQATITLEFSESRKNNDLILSVVGH